MPNFVYTARDQRGRVQTRSSRAGSRGALIARLRGQGLTVTEIQETDARAKRPRQKKLSSLGMFQPRVKVDDLAVYSRQFATMAGAGIPLAQCLDTLSEQTENSTLSKATIEIKNGVEGGGGLAEALAEHPNIFSNLYVSMVKAGEAAGAFEIILNQLAELLEKQRDLRNKVKSALFLPVMVLGFCFLITIGLIVFVVPKFADIFEELDAELPAPTQMLITISQEIRGPKGLIAVVAVILLVFVIRKIVKTERGGYIWDQVKLKLPLFGDLTMKKVVANFARTLALLDRSGVPILESLDIVADTVDNRVMSRAIGEVRSGVQEGKGISEPLRESQIFPPMITNMVVVGEEVGSVEVMLTKVADLYEDDVERAVESLTKLIEPIMMIFVGLLVGSILICMYLPIFNIAGTVGV